MACCGGPRPVRKNTTQHLTEAPVAGEETYLEYTGTRIGAFTVWGRATGKNYRVSRKQPVFLVDTADVESITYHPGFRVLSRPKSAAPSTVSKRPDTAANVAKQVSQMFPTRIMRPRDERGTSKV